MSTTEQAGRPGRYQRSAFGLVVALVATVLAVVLVMAFMGLFRHKTAVKPQPVDYLAAVRDAQEGHLTPVYPRALPGGYIATQAEVPDDGDGFEIDLLKGDTADADFIGVRVAKRSVLAELVHEEVDKEASKAPSYDVPASVAHPLARSWAGYRDSKGDSGYAASAGRLNVLVYGSAPAADLQQVVDSLTTAPLARRR